MKNLDKTAWIGIIGCVIVLLLSVQHSTKVQRQNFEKAREAQAQREKEAAEARAKAPVAPETPTETPDGTSVAAAIPKETAAKEVELATDKFKLTFTNRGAGIKKAQLLDHLRTLGSEGDYVTLNETRDDPIGAFSSKPNEMDQTTWVIKSQTDSSVTFATDTPEKLHIEKTYRLPDPAKLYQVELEISIRNDSGAPIELNDTGARFIYVGGAAPLHFNEWPMQIGMFYRDGRYFKTKTVDYFGGKKKILGLFGRSEKPYAYFPGEEKIADNLAFAGVNDQFFALLIQAKEPVDGQMWADKYPVVIDGDKEKSTQKRMRGCELAMSLPNVALKPGDQQTLGYDFYIGPKEAAILKQSPDEWSKIMNYSQIPIFGKIFGWAISPLAAVLSMGLVAIKGIVGNYGWAIVILTIIVRLLMWPVYAKSTRSMKRMSKLTPMMKEIKEKYPDDPQKVNTETMKLYKEYGVNPMGGCLPMFLQLPVFLGFYRMLWGAVELRHESFLGFVHDLTMPDNLATIPGLDMPLNILPILMSAASFVQMAMTPKTGDNTQRMIFMMMPVLFLVFCYNFASGLALYWTVSNVFTIFQTWLMNKLPEPELNKTKKAKSGKKGFFQKLQEQVEAAQAQQQQGGKATAGGPSKKKAQKTQPNPQPGQSRTKLSSEKGSRHTKSKKKKR